MYLNRTYFKNQEKKLKKYPEEQRRLQKILLFMKQCETYQELKHHSLAALYGFEELRHTMSGYCGFNLCRANSGMIRLIFRVDIKTNIIDLIYISMDHYIDFKRSIS